MHGAAGEWLDAGYMKIGVDAPKVDEGQLQNSCQADDPTDGEGTNEVGSQLAGIHFKGKVLDGQPNPLTHTVPRNHGLMTISLFLGPGKGTEKGCTCLPPSLAATANKGLG